MEPVHAYCDFCPGEDFKPEQVTSFNGYALCWWCAGSEALDTLNSPIHLVSPKLRDEALNTLALYLAFQLTLSPARQPQAVLAAVRASMESRS